MKKISIVLLGLIGFSLNLINSKAEILNRVEQSNGNISLSLHTDQGYMDAFEATIDVTGDVKIKDFKWDNNLDSMAVKKMAISENKKSLHLLVASKATNLLEQSKVISLGNLQVESSNSASYSVNLSKFSLTNLDMENVTAKELVQQGKTSFNYVVKTNNPNNNPNENQSENEEQPPSTDDNKQDNSDSNNNDDNNENNNDNNVNNDNNNSTNNSEPNQGETSKPTPEINDGNNSNNSQNNSSSNNNSNNFSNSNDNNSPSVNSGLIGSGVATMWQEQGTTYTYSDDDNKPLEETEEDNKDIKEEKEDNSPADNQDLENDEENIKPDSQKETEPQEKHLFQINQKFILGALAIVGVVVIMIVIKIKKNNDY